MKRWGRTFSGFTIVELLIVVVVIGILAAIILVAYNGIQKKAAAAQVVSTAKGAGSATALAIMQNGNTTLTHLPSSFKVPKELAITYSPLSNKQYGPLTNVQHGVLLHTYCEQLVQDANYSTIHSRDGSETSSIVMSCGDDIEEDSLQITGWDTKTWTTPVTKAQITDYLATVPYDNWWTDKQDVIRNFYTTLIVLYTSSGGGWPINSFWDPWANQWSGVQKETLPTPISSTVEPNYCISVSHRQYTDLSYMVTAGSPSPRVGSCL